MAYNSMPHHGMGLVWWSIAEKGIKLCMAWKNSYSKRSRLSPRAKVRAVVKCFAADLTALEARGLDMARAGEMFDGAHITFPDIRFDYGEERFLTFGFLDGRMVVLAWTPREKATRIISVRKANEREEKRYHPRSD